MKKFNSQVDFVVIYITEAHPTNGWNINKGLDDSVCYLQPKTMEERFQIAEDFIKRYDFPTESFYVDNLSNEVDISYYARPERLFVVHEGKIIYVGGPGPFHYSPQELNEFLESYLLNTQQKKYNNEL